MKIGFWLLCLASFLVVPAGIAAQDCGDCEDDTYPFPPFQDVHRFSPGNEFDCEGPPGHAVHDCAEGDQDWFNGTCDGMHDACGGGGGGEAELAALTNEDRVSPAVAAYFASQYSERVALRQGRLQVLGCGDFIREFLVQEERPIPPKATGRKR